MIFLLQQKYAFEILDDVGLLGAKPIRFPMEQNIKLAPNEGDFRQPSLVHALGFHLIYLAITRFDIIYSVLLLSQFMHKLWKPLLDAA